MIAKIPPGRKDKKTSFKDLDDFERVRQVAPDGHFFDAQVFGEATLHLIRFEAEKRFAHVNSADFQDVVLRQIFRADELYVFEREERHVHEETQHRRAHEQENYSAEQPAESSPPSDNCHVFTSVVSF